MRAAPSSRVERAIRGVFGSGAAVVHESGMSDSYSLPDARGWPRNGLAVFAFYDALEQTAILVGGTWPASEDGGAVESAPRHDVRAVRRHGGGLPPLAGSEAHLAWRAAANPRSFSVGSLRTLQDRRPDSSSD
jgi:hypothetical protein